MATKLPKAARTAINARPSPAMRLAVRSDRVSDSLLLVLRSWVQVEWP